MLAPDADFVHPVEPGGSMKWREGPLKWKENWCFAGVDTSAGVAVVWHVSLRPGDDEGIFTCKVDGPDVRVRHVGRHPLGELVAGEPLGDGAMRFVVVEPWRRFLLTYAGDDGVELSATYTARFDAFDFADGPLPAGESAIGELGRHVFPFHHYEQALSFEATVRRPGHDALELRGWANRDHSWGRRDDFMFRSHHWICASFDDSYVQGSTMVDTTFPERKFGGFVSDRAGNDPVRFVDVSANYWEHPAERPLGPFERDVTYVLDTVGGRRIELTAHLAEHITILFLNARHPDRTQVYQDAQVFCRYTRHDTGQQGAGLLELGKHLTGAGIADRVRA